MKRTLLSLTMSTLLISANVHAVAYGEDVLASEYQDHTVRFEVFHPSDGGDKNKTTCGGLLIAGQYILTAGHCIGDRIETQDDENKRYDWYVDNGAENEITVFQGIEVDTPNRTTLKYSVIDIDTTSADHDVIDAAWREEYEFVKNQHPEFDWQMMDNSINSNISSERLKTHRHQDIGLIKLEKAIPQMTHAAIVAAFDPIEQTFRISDEQHFTFKGWGRTDKHPQPTTTMQKTELIWRNTGGTEEFGGEGGWVNRNSYAPNFAKRWTGGTPPVENCTDNTHNCDYGRTDFFPLFPKRKASLPLSGDSGTPLMLNSNQVIAIAKSTQTAVNPEFTMFTHVGHYIPLLIDRIDTLAAPASIQEVFEVEVEFEGSIEKGGLTWEQLELEPITTSFVVQNLTNETLTLNPFLQGSNVEVTVTGCESKTLQPSQFCEMTVSMNGLGSTVLHFGDNRNTEMPISLSIKEIVNPDGNNGDNPDENNGDGGGDTGSSGGSMGLFSLLLMVVLRTMRQQR
ncbi:trypsin-like serine protease [Vibrio cincinnatiensis]|uniref:trypsin-like serine protease n=1 Tax=Vibrio cincinnatiensis TaxID=675 RepID=UPI001EE02029|nr:trypsin-like serine protease [Vibrio cincinnatiensis]MCG3744815.1 trypsin-like serine protease [Vibrio cincinnatiensis]